MGAILNTVSTALERLILSTYMQISAGSKYANNQFLKIQVTRTPFQKTIIDEDSAYIFFSNIDNVYAGNQHIMKKRVKSNC